MSLRFPIALALAAAAGFPAAAAGDALYDVLVDTKPLMSSAAGPFLLDFQFTDGSGTDDGNNTVTLLDFNFGSGSAIGLPMTMGYVSGDLTHGVTMTDGAFFNCFMQEFTPGAILNFVVRLTTNADLADVPDEFSFAILDGAMQGNAMLVADINSAAPVMQTFPNEALGLKEPLVTPEPASGWLFAGGMLLMGFAVWRRWGRAGSAGRWR